LFRGKCLRRKIIERSVVRCSADTLGAAREDVGVRDEKAEPRSEISLRALSPRYFVNNSRAADFPF